MSAIRLWDNYYLIPTLQKSGWSSGQKHQQIVKIQLRLNDTDSSLAQAKK